MEQGFSDLVPVFVEEARERLERLSAGVGRLGRDPEAVAEVRRELHTLKGSARMLGFGALSELCHAAEDALAAGHAAGLAAPLTRAVDELAAMVETIAGGEGPEAAPELIAALRRAAGEAGEGPGAEGSTTAGRSVSPAPDGGETGDGPEAPLPGASTAPAEPAPRPGLTGGEVRVDAPALDEIADRATQLRLMTLAASRAGERIYELARFAEDGLHEEQPRQVLAVLAAMLRKTAVELEGDQRLMLRTAEAQLDRVLSLQVQPLRGPLHAIARAARRLAVSLGKEVDVEIAGEETRLDRRIARDLEDALLHLVRNAVDHGLESPEDRRRAGKAPAGRLLFTAGIRGSRVRLEIRDDGPGIDPRAIVRQAVEAGLVDRADAGHLGRDEAFRLLFAPGFSTRRRVSEISGRGVGLDVVAAAAARVGGEVFLRSAPGEGTTVVLEVPVARRGEQVLVVAVGQARLALPSGVVQRIGALAAADVVERDGRTLARVDGRLVPFVPLARAWGETAREPQLLLEGSVSGRAIAVAVDDVEGEEEVLVRPLPRASRAGRMLDGMALLSSGLPVGVLSPAGLGGRDPGLPRTAAQPRAEPARRVQVLLVEDSLVTREMERRLLEDAGFRVTAVGDADEALGRLAEERFDCLVTDIEMPGMDGFELTEQLRAMEHFAQLPIVVVSTRDRPEDRLRGLRAGADAYVTKQGLDAGELVDLVRRLAGR